MRSDKWGFGLSAQREFAPIGHAYSYFKSHIVSLHFVALEEVCPGADFAALQQRIRGPGPSLPQ